MRRSHRVTPEMTQVKFSKEEKRRRNLLNQGDYIIVGDRAKCSEVHLAHGIRTTKRRTNLSRV